MHAPWGRVAALAMLVGLVVVPATVLTSAPAQAATGSARPSAIAVDSSGTSYIGYPTGNALSRVSRNGGLLEPIALDLRGPVNGLAVDNSDRIWIAHDDAVSVIDRRGTVLRRIARDPGATCAHDGPHYVTRYGGLALTATQVVVADRCRAFLEVYDRRTGRLDTRVRLAARAHGLAWRRGAGRSPARLFVTQPERGTVLTFHGDRLRAGQRPAHTLRLKTPYGGSRPVPSGVVIDRYGTLAVSDRANHAVYLFEINKGYQFFRTLGHPADPGSADGYLNQPAAMAQFAQDGSGLSGNLFIADLLNGRVQRWDVGGGYTFWVRALSPPRVGPPDPDPDPTPDPDPDPTPDPDAAPTSTTRPRITAASGGRSLLCSTGRWTGGTASYGFQWLRDGTRVPGASGSSYSLGAADQGTELVCRVTATTTAGSGSAASDPWFVGTAVAPANTSAPTILGTPARGRTLTCATGGWTGTPAPRFSYVWLRGSVQVGSASTHVVTAGDVGRRLGCTVIATNQAGSASASARPVTPTGAAPAPSRRCAGPAAVSIAGGAGYVRSARVVLTVRVPAGTTAIRVSNDRSFARARSVRRHRDCGVAWTLRVPASDRTAARVYVRWTGSSGSGGSRVVADSVRFDRSGPRVTAATVRYGTRRWVLRVTGSDVSGVRAVTYAPAGRARALRTVRVSSRSASVTVPSPESARWVRLTDGLGNVGPWRRVG